MDWTGLDRTGHILTAPDSYGQYIVAIIIVYACFIHYNNRIHIVKLLTYRYKYSVNWH